MLIPKLVTFFQVKVTPPQGNFGEIPLLAAVQPVLPTLPTGPWGSGLDGESNVAFFAPPTAVAPVRSPVSVSAPTHTQVPAQIQTPVPVSAQAAAVPDPPTSTLINAQTSIPVVPTPGQALAKAPFETSKLSSTTSDASTIDDAKPPAQSSTAPVLQPAGNQATLAECASLTTSHQTLDSTSASINLQHEPCIEVRIKTDQTSLNRLLLWLVRAQNKHVHTKTSFTFILPLHKVIAHLYQHVHHPR